MIKKICVIITFLCVAVCAESAPNPFSNMEGLNCNYYGDINNKYKIGMSVLFEGNSISGSYFYVSQLKDIKIIGHVISGSKVRLDAMDANNRIIETFEGTIIDSTHHDPRKKQHNSKERLTGEVISGIWYTTNNPTKKMPFYIRLDNATSYEKGQSRYAVAGADNEALIEQSAQKLRNAVKSGNVKQVASLIEFPISALVKNKKKPLNNYTEFINNYSLIFTQPFREAIINSVPHNMFTNANGIMLGKYGELWFNAQGKVYVINNYFSTTCTVTHNKIHKE